MQSIKVRFFCMTVGWALLCAVLSACGGSPAPVSAQPPVGELDVPILVPVSAQSTGPADELDAAIRAVSDYLNQQLSKGNKLVVLNVQSEFPALSEYIIDELIANTVNDRFFSVVDRQQLNTIRAELEFQMSGEVDDDTAQALGRMAGAQIIISGAVSRIGDLYRLRIRALSVQSAQIAGQVNRNIPDGPTIAALVQSRATGYGGESQGAARSTSPAVPVGIVATPAAAPVPASTAQTAQTPAPVVPAEPPAPKTYKIGDEGPAGGLIFYDKGNNSGGWRYLEAAPEDIGKLVMATESIGGKGERAMGAGKANTQAIMEEANNRGGGFGWAAQAVDTLVVNGFDDWFLPSRDELNYMYGNLHLRGLGGFSGGWYWSSTFYYGHLLPEFWGENFSNGNQNVGGFGNQNNVRACRQF